MPRAHRGTVGAVLWAVAASEPEPPGPSEGGDDALRGIPGSPGIIEGPARIIGHPGEFHRVQPGDIVVCGITQASWSPIFDVIGGLVTERGGPLSHPGTLAREYGLPCVLSVAGASSTIPDGTLLRVDGAQGTVSLVDG